MRNGKRALIGLAALAVVSLVGTTWAYWTQELVTGNEFMTAKYDTALAETFQSPDDWQPGIETEKKVWVENKGTVPVLAKIAINQNWVRREDIYAVTTPGGEPQKVKPSKGEAMPLIFQTNRGKEYAAILNFNTANAAVLASGRAEAESLRLNLPVVQNASEAEGKWLLVDEKPDGNGEYLFYYIGRLNPGEKTPILLESVTMNPGLQNSVVGHATTYIKNDSEYKAVTVDRLNTEVGYDEALFTLNVTSTTVQATKNAVSHVFGTAGADRDIIDYLSDSVADSGIYTNDTEKKLYFEQNQGKMTYTPYRTEDGKEDGNWFMSFTNMVPGGVYNDKLQIENGSRKDFNVYMQILPRTQDALKDELLELISMKVYIGEYLIYDGKATGKPYGNKENLQDAIYLGYFPHKSEGNIRVQLTLDPGLSLDEKGQNQYADVLTKIDWKFMVQEETSGGNDDGGNTPGPKPGIEVSIPEGDVPLGQLDQPEEVVGIPESDVPLTGLIPKTGDEQPVGLAAAAVLVSGIMLAGLIYGFKKKKGES